MGPVTVGEVSCPLLLGLMMWASHVSCLSLGVLLCQVGPVALFPRTVPRLQHAGAATGLAASCGL